MCHTTLLSTPTSSQTCAVRSSGSRRRSQIRRAASSAQTGLTSVMSRVKPCPHCLLQHMRNICKLSCFLIFVFHTASSWLLFSSALLPSSLPTHSGGPGPLQPAEPGGDGPAEGAAPGCLPPTDGDQEEPDGAGKQQHGDPDRHLQTPANHCRVSVKDLYLPFLSYLTSYMQ